METNLQEVTRGQRAVHFLIDAVFVFLLMLHILGFIERFIDISGYLNDGQIHYIYLTLLFLYYFVCETVFNRTVGKFITNTKVVTAENTNLTIGKTFLRTLSRFIPLEPISGFTYPWHDTISSTIVIKVDHYAGSTLDSNKRYISSISLVTVIMGVIWIVKGLIDSYPLLFILISIFNAAGTAIILFSPYLLFKTGNLKNPKTIALLPAIFILTILFYNLFHIYTGEFEYVLLGKFEKIKIWWIKIMESLIYCFVAFKTFSKFSNGSPGDYLQPTSSIISENLS